MVRKAIVSGTSKSPSASNIGYLVLGNGSWPTFRTEDRLVHMACERIGAWFAEWNEQRATKLKDMLEASIQRRFPKGLKVRVRSVENNGCLRDLAQRLRSANLSITRAKVTCPDHSTSC